MTALPTPRVTATWADLGSRARAWRLLHAGWAGAQFACLGVIWARVIGRQRDPLLWASVAFVGAEGAALAVGRGDCPMGGVQEAWGDPVPFFELLLPPRAAKAAIPILAGVSLVGMAGVVFRAPGVVLRWPPDGRRARRH